MSRKQKYGHSRSVISFAVQQQLVAVVQRNLVCFIWCTYTAAVPMCISSSTYYCMYCSSTWVLDYKQQCQWYNSILQGYVS